MQNGDAVRELVTAQMTLIEDVRLVAVIRELLVDPYPVVREWDYGAQGDADKCWTVLEHRESNRGIAY